VHYETEGHWFESSRAHLSSCRSVEPIAATSKRDLTRAAAGDFWANGGRTDRSSYVTGSVLHADGGRTAI
jgi:hypothetical protein